MAFYGKPIFPHSVSAVTSAAEFPLGTRRVDASGNEYIYGYNAAANSPVYPGVPVVHPAGATSYSFTATNAASQVGFVAAVCHHSTIPTGYYGWFGVKGFFRAVPDETQTQMATGDALYIGVNGGWVLGTASNTSTLIGYTTGIAWGYAAESIVTGYGSCASEATSGLGCLGRAWITTHLG